MTILRDGSSNSYRTTLLLAGILLLLPAATSWTEDNSPSLEAGVGGDQITAQDFSSLKKAKDEIKAQHAFTLTLLNTLPVAVFYKDREGLYLGCNDVFSEIMGVSAEDIRGKSVYELWPSELANRYHKADLDLMEHPEHQVYEFQVKDKNGTTRPVIFSKQVYRRA